jgi:AbrB family looped-hinge helix DNA binding protein
VSKVTSKLQVTIPKAIAERYAITPGDELDWVPATDSVRLVPAKALQRKLDKEARLALFDAATKRQRAREGQHPTEAAVVDRGWTREELYERGRAR